MLLTPNDYWTLSRAFYLLSLINYFLLVVATNLCRILGFSRLSSIWSLLFQSPRFLGVVGEKSILAIVFLVWSTPTTNALSPGVSEQGSFGLSIHPSTIHHGYFPLYYSSPKIQEEICQLEALTISD